MKLASLGSAAALAVALALAPGAGAAPRAGDPLAGLPPPPEPPQGFFRMRGYALADEAVQKLGLDLAIPKADDEPARGTLMIGSWRYSLQEVRLRRRKGVGKTASPGPVRAFKARLFALPALVPGATAPAVPPPGPAPTPGVAASPPTTDTPEPAAARPPRKGRRGKDRAASRLERAGELEVYTVARTYGVAPVEILRGWARIGRRHWDLVGSPGKTKP